MNRRNVPQYYERYDRERNGMFLWDRYMRCWVS
jgi:hypothetical protein